MSRICVKNIPKYVAEDRLRDFFSQKGEVTDAKVMKTKDGKSRQFAFVGFRIEAEAQQALKYFHHSFLDTSRITCEIALKVGDPNAPRPWSRYSAKKQDQSTDKNKKSPGAKSSNPVESKKDTKNSKKSKDTSDPQLQEFLQVMQPRSKSKLWANDALANVPAGENGKVSGKEVQLHKGDRKRSGSVQDGSDEDEDTDSENDNENESYEIPTEKLSHEPSHDEVFTAMDYFNSRIKNEWSDSENGDSDSLREGHDVHDNNADENSDLHAGDPSQNKAEEEPSETSQGEVDDSGNQSSEAPNVEEQQVLETGRLFVRNLPYTATEDDLAELFSNFGNLSEVHLVKDKETKQSKGFAYVLYQLPESALRALEELDKSIFQGRLLHIMPAKQPNSSEKQRSSTVGQASKTLKQQREEQRKASEASGNTQAWSSLYMRPDTVVENIARTHGVSKSEFLDPEANDLAQRVALGETQVISETKNTFAKAGINVAALESAKAGSVKRSTHVILVKNLPYSSSEEDLAKLFGSFGSLDKVILPTTKTLALVVFLEAAEARAAFKGLAYKRYKDAPLYLEWAPSEILSPTSTLAPDTSNSVIVGAQDVKRVLLEQRLEGTSEVDIDPDRTESRSMFVKNLNFQTTDESLKMHFREHINEGSISSVKITKHLKNGKNVSTGFGFIEFDSVETAANVCRDLQGTVLDRHALILQLCHAKKNEHVQKKVDKDRSTTKLIVRNVAFEATEKDLRQLFSPFGQIKSLRLPMKFGNHRGFAFVEFVTKQEAQNALNALSNTHLYGRHLVLERAKEGETLDDLRARTAARFTDEENGFQNPTKLSKKRKRVSVVDESSVKFERIAD